MSCRRIAIGVGNSIPTQMRHWVPIDLLYSRGWCCDRAGKIDIILVIDIGRAKELS